MKIGQEVICIKRGAWWSNRRGQYRSGIDPSYKEECMVTAIEMRDSFNCLRLLGYEGLYHSKQFIPLNEYEAHNEAVEEITKNIPKIHEHQ